MQHFDPGGNVSAGDGCAPGLHSKRNFLTCRRLLRLSGGPTSVSTEEQILCDFLGSGRPGPPDSLERRLLLGSK